MKGSRAYFQSAKKKTPKVFVVIVALFLSSYTFEKFLFRRSWRKGNEKVFTTKRWPRTFALRLGVLEFVTDVESSRGKADLGNSSWPAVVWVR